MCSDLNEFFKMFWLMYPSNQSDYSERIFPLNEMYSEDVGIEYVLEPLKTLFDLSDTSNVSVISHSGIRTQHTGLVIECVQKEDGCIGTKPIIIVNIVEEELDDLSESKFYNYLCDKGLFAQIFFDRIHGVVNYVMRLEHSLFWVNAVVIGSAYTATRKCCDLHESVLEYPGLSEHLKEMALKVIILGRTNNKRGQKRELPTLSISHHFNISHKPEDLDTTTEVSDGVYCSVFGYPIIDVKDELWVIDRVKIECTKKLPESGYELSHYDAYVLNEVCNNRLKGKVLSFDVKHMTSTLYGSVPVVKDDELSSALDRLLGTNQ